MNFTLQNWPEEHKLDLANQLELITSRKPGLHLQETRTKRWSSWRKRSSWQPGMMTDQPVQRPPPPRTLGETGVSRGSLGGARKPRGLGGQAVPGAPSPSHFP